MYQSRADDVKARSPDFGLAPEVAKMSWRRFLTEAVFPSSMADYWYCPAKIVNMQLYGSIKTEVTERGSVYHEEVTVKIIKKLGPLRKVKIETVYDVMRHAYYNISGALSDGHVLANSEDAVLFRAVSPELKIAGMPDKADCRNGKEPILMDFKTTKNLPSEAWASNSIQLGAYMIGVERLGFRQTCGVIRYVLESNGCEYREFKVYLDNYLRDEVKKTAELVRSILNSGDPRPTSNPRKCAACSYRDLCQWSLFEGEVALGT